MEIKRKMGKAPCLAVFGTGSEVGKSIVATALCRFFLNRGIRVAPFKAQNMSNNSGITAEGLEMGRAQIVQAEASGLAPHVDMNPVLLKPTSDVGSQVVIMGEAVDNSTASEYHRRKKSLIPTVHGALDRLREEYDLVVMEGAGSCAEVNLMKHDIVNFPMAEYAEASVILVGDIHRGGVFAQIVGTLECLSQDGRQRIAGCIINRFRGDIDLFKDGVSWIEEKTDKRVFGVLPWYNHISIEAEDSVVLESPEKRPKTDGPAIAVIRIPHISNFTDFDPLVKIDGLNLVFIETPEDLTGHKGVIIPGSKNTRFDLNWLYQTGWADHILSFAKGGGSVLGVCGGYQMMGSFVYDPQGLEGAPGKTPGLSLLPVETVLKAPKTTTLARFRWGSLEGSGYEIHMGQTERVGGAPMFVIKERNKVPCNVEDGCVAPGGKAMGTYMHGMFDSPEVTKRWLGGIGLSGLNISGENGLMARDRQYDLLGEHFEKHVDTEAIYKCI